MSGDSPQDKECSAKPKHGRLRRGFAWYTRHQARCAFWEALRLVRPCCILDLQRTVFPAYSESAVRPAPLKWDPVDGWISKDRWLFRNEEQISDSAVLLAMGAWQSRWNLSYKWLIPYIDLALCGLCFGEGWMDSDPEPCSQSAPVAQGSQEDLDVRRDELELVKALDARLRSRHRETAPDEARFDFQDWWYLPAGEPWSEALERITGRFEKALQAYAARVERCYMTSCRGDLEVQKHHPRHFIYLVQHLVPDGYGRTTPQAGTTGAERTQVYRCRSKTLGPFLGLTPDAASRSRVKG